MPPVEENDLYALNWSYFEKNLKDEVSKFEKNTDFTDVTFLCQDKTFHAHRFVLHAGSDFFREFFKNNPIKNPIFVMYHVKSFILEKILKFLYSGEVQVDKRNLEELILLAESLKIKGIASVESSTAEIITDEELTKLPVKRKKPPSISPMRKNKLQETTQTVDSSSDEESLENKVGVQEDQQIDKDQLEDDESNEFFGKEDKEEKYNSTALLQPGKFLNKSFTRYKRLVSSIEKDADISTHVLLKGTRRRCGQCSIQKIEKRTCYYCKVCEIGLCINCFKPFHDLTILNGPKLE